MEAGVSMAEYTFGDLLSRYGIKKSAFSRFLARHLEEINKSGNHAIKSPSGWIFDDFAVEILDRLRNFGEVSPESTDSAQVNSLKEIISSLQQKVIALQDENGNLKTQLIDASRDQVKLTKQLAAASIEVLKLQQSNTSDNDNLEIENKALKVQVDKLKRQVSTMETESKRVYAENNELHDKIKQIRQSHNANKGAYSRWSRKGSGRRITLFSK